MSFVLYKAFAKILTRSGTSHPALFFLHDFRRKIFLMLYFFDWPNFIVRLPLFFDKLGNMSIVIICCPVCAVINFAINLNILVKPFSRWSISQIKNVNVWRTKRAFNMKWKVFFIIFKGLLVCQKLSQSWKWPLTNFI